MISVEWPCTSCMHYYKELKDGWDVACKAFPEGIPDEWLKVDVTVLSECANGYKYKLIKEIAGQKRAG